MNDIFKEILERNKNYSDLLAGGKKPDEALRTAFGEIIAAKTKEQIKTINQITNN